ncbi:hypothetical protein GCM10022254_05010 [Actinomadura meridiana]|uniref:Low temperature requirement protein A n=1 Tax=Actinomadura meridiana TaxID=559626 RepID=A0ABP8BT20_9ACTN
MADAAHRPEAFLDPGAARPHRVMALLRERGGQNARVTFFELFFDLVFVFAITQLSHRLLEHLTVRGAAETLLLLLAVWWAWMYTCWTTNWFSPDHPAIRLMLVAVMIAGLFMAAMLAPWHGFATPLLGRSSTTEWTIDGSHMAERCQLFLIIALGETVLVTGSTLGGHTPSAAVAAGFVSAFVGTVALWWIYFDHTAEAAAGRIAASADPGRLGRSAYTFIHIVMIAGIVVGAVADEKVMAHPGGHVDTAFAVVALGGPALFVAGHSLFKQVVFGGFTAARVTALLALAVLAVPALATDVLTPLALHICSSVVVVALALWDVRAHRLRRRESAHLLGPAHAAGEEATAGR